MDATRRSTMAEYRSVGTEHREDLRALLRHAFDPERGPVRDEPDGPWPPTFYDQRGLFADGDLVSACKLYYLTATVRDEWTEIGGFGGVATPPEHRRRGYARQLLREALREYREAGVDLVALWPALIRFYRGLGWGTANWDRRAAVPPAQLDGVAGAREAGDSSPDGRFRHLTGEDWERLRSVEVERAERYGLSLRRSETWWRERTLAAWASDAEPYVYGVERDGDLAGYVIYRVQSGEDGRHLDVRDLAGVDRAAERALLGFLADHDSQVETVRVGGPLAEDLLDLVPDPEEIETGVEPGPMVRFADAERGLAGLSWPADADVRLVLAVTDALVDHNDGRYRLDVAGGAATVEPAGPEATTDATVDVGTLSRLAVGAIGVDRAERVGGLEVQNEGSRRDLRAAFQPEPVYLREFF